MTREIKVNGYTLEINPVSPLAPKAIELKYKRVTPEPKKPVYTVDGAGGVQEEVEHTLETLETLEEKEAYLQWKETHDAWMAGYNHQITRFFLVFGVKLKLTKPQEKKLEKQLELLDITFDDEQERDLFYLETFIVNSADNMQAVMSAILQQTGIKGEDVEAANALFRPEME